MVLSNCLLFMVTLFCPNIPSRPDLFLILPPVIVPRMDVFFSDGVPCGVPGFMLPRWNFIVKILVPHGQKYQLITPAPDMLSKDDRSSKGISPGGRNPLLNFSITSAESCKQRERGDNYDYSWHWGRSGEKSSYAVYFSCHNVVSCHIHHGKCEMSRFFWHFRHS